MATFLTGSQIVMIPYQISECCTFRNSNGAIMYMTTNGEQGGPAITNQEEFADVFTEANGYYSISGNGNCLLQNPTTPPAGCKGSIPITQSMDVCDLAVNGFLQLEASAFGVCH